MTKRILVLSIALFSVCVVNYGQKLEFGLGVGASTYWGDLNAPDFTSNFNNSGFAVELSGRAVYSKYLGVRLNLMYGTVNGSDSRSTNLWQRERNLSFSSYILEMAALGEFYFFQYDEESFFVPYLTAGLSVFAFDPTTRFQGAEVRLQPLGTEGQGLNGYDQKYSLVSASIPFGAGGKIKITDKMNISFDVILRRTFTDYLDDVSKKYVNFNEFISNGRPLTAQLANRIHEFRGTQELVNLPTGSQRGGEKVKDYFFTTMVGIHFSMGEGFRKKKGYKSSCPKF